MAWSKLILRTGFRLLSVMVLMLLVSVVIRLTPFPDLNAREESCNRPCHELEWPRICRFEFTLESHTFSRRSNCGNQTGHCFEDEFTHGADGTFLTVNRQIPGPAIHVCLHDIIVVNVENRIPNQNVAIHWRGQVQGSNPLMDGVPMITQCPIPSFTKFQYKFRASNVGTHAWHLYNSENGIFNNIYGMLVVRESIRKEVHQKLIDSDQSSHIIMLRSLKNSQQSMILINGNNPSTKEYDNTDIIFEVYQNKRYRFRVVHSGGSNRCPITGFISEHKLLIIALDGNAIEPLLVDQFTIVAGERIDFIVWTNQNRKEFDIKFISAQGCDKSVATAKLKYFDNNLMTTIRTSLFSNFPQYTKFSTVATEFNKNGSLGLHDIKVLLDPSPTVLKKDADDILYLHYGHQNTYLENVKKMFDVAYINNISFKYPSSPLASQITDVPVDQKCNENNLPQNCFRENNAMCQCTHVADIEIGSAVDIILIHRDLNPEEGHIFHLHGHKFYLLNRLNSSSLRSVSDIKTFDYSGKLKRNLEKPVLKDTVWVPPGGLAIIRFLAENAGYWMLREERSQGMEIVLNVFGSHYDVPNLFPRCGNFIGPKYFLA